MGSNIAGFANGFIKKVNRNFEEAKMMEYENFIYDRKRKDELEDWKIQQNETQRIDQENAVAEANIAAGVVKAEAVSNRELEQERVNRNFDRVKQAEPNLTDEQARIIAQGNDASIVNFENEVADGNEWQIDPATGSGRWLTPDERDLIRANFIVDTFRPADMPPDIFGNTPYGRELRSYIMLGKTKHELQQAGYTPKYITDENGIITGAEIVFKDPDMYEPDQYEYDNLSSAANRVLSTVNDMTDDIIFDSDFNILQGDMAIAFHNLEQLASDRYVRGKGRIRENKAVDSVFTKERLELLAELTDTRMELPNYFLALASDPASVESLTLSIQAMDDVDELLDIYENCVP